MKIKFLVLAVLFLTINTYSQTTIKLEQKNGVFYVPCKIKNIPLKFVFDTGASNVSISLTEAMFLLKHGGLSFKDIKKSTKFKIANGTIQEGTKVIIPKINIADIELNNIEATVVHNMEAPLLLGQSAISKLGRFQIDKDKLIIFNKRRQSSEFYKIDFNETFYDFSFTYSLDNLVSWAKSKNKIGGDGAIDKGYDTKHLNIISNENWFKSINFDKEIFRFHKSGIIHSVELTKNTKTPKKLFNQLKNKIKNEYGDFNFIKETVATWTSNNNFVIYLAHRKEKVFIICINSKVVNTMQ
ncbi:hypothetical protein KUL156_40140 [Alteromonas sp. KUL156]|nr:hypothetical protein KUL154_08970 [Alteromonas sp. KUL154]GFE01422.1 hypothetical protein KUL156_40140 [Alteromonas sp. KUL156]